ncbi:MAG: hypothetical protein V1754_13470, partial [Pseudomonadota bacterium]
CTNKCAEKDYACEDSCYLATTDVGQKTHNALLYCVNNNCDGAPDIQVCTDKYCTTQINDCYQIGTGNKDCSGIYDCAIACPSNDSTCFNNCYGQGTTLAQTQYSDMNKCINDNCSQYSGSKYVDCVWGKCGNEIETCLKPAHCNITGGDCGPGLACYPMSATANDCMPSDEKGLGQPCTTASSTNDPLSCDDGLICMKETSGARCFAFCTKDADCTDGGKCQGPIFNGISDIGVCVGGLSSGDGGGPILPDLGPQDGGIGDGSQQDTETGEGGGGCAIGGKNASQGLPTFVILLFLAGLLFVRKR